jgi:hypothetical protein
MGALWSSNLLLFCVCSHHVLAVSPNAEMFRHKLPALPKQYGDEEEKKNLNVYLERFPLYEIMKM